MLHHLAALLLSNVTVSLPMEATVAGLEIELGEIATIEGGDLETRARLSALEIGYAPAPGYSRVLVARRIASAIKRYAPDVEVTFTGHQAVRVRPDAVRIKSSDVEKAARTVLAKYAIDARFTLRDPIRDVLVPRTAEPPVLFPKINDEAIKSGVVNVPVEVHVEGVLYRTVWMSFASEIYRTVPVLARGVRAGEALTSKHFEQARIAWQPGPDTKGLDPSQLTGAVAARNLQVGQVLTGRDVHRPVLVEQGRMVLLSVRKGSVSARVTAIALEAGAVGDIVRVRTLGSERELEGRVLRRDLIQVDLGQ